MKRVLTILFSTLFIMFLCGCSYNTLNPNDKTPSKTMYVKLKISGISSKNGFNKQGSYPRKVNIERKGYKAFTFKGTGTHEGYTVTGFCNDGGKGNSMAILVYIGNDTLKIDYKDSEKEKVFNGYLSVQDDGASLFYRSNIDLNIPLSQFNENTDKNIALFSIEIYPDLYTTSDTPYKYTFDGFEKK